ncbi:hypothetical protein ACKKBF_B37690 [Auxenochlorella protothecoides x Auxenochlorella symbiontica]
MSEHAHDTRSVTPTQSALAGMGAALAGAMIGGGAHYMGTAKQLAEEGVDPRARLRALPVAAKALGASLVLCGIFAAGGVAMWRMLGMHMHPQAEVSSVAEAVDLIRQQREVISHEFRAKLLADEPHSSAEEAHSH